VKESIPRRNILGRQWNVELMTTASEVIVMKVNEKV